MGFAFCVESEVESAQAPCELEGNLISDTCDESVPGERSALRSVGAHVLLFGRPMCSHLFCPGSCVGGKGGGAILNSDIVVSLQ